ncbi:phosphatase PAP2 family protein [Rhodococcoides yunnanense]|uniref:phosphatase PAP2 family protein n=1 Tax=Rhodococcoides yunnanense TaxID=278209 RepID=UPI000A077CF8|nr:phosphatase PAP2 family protein [Rhodococcus yunnanensis]
MDSDVLQWMVEHRVGWLTDAFWVITTIGNTFAMAVLATVTVLVLLRLGRRTDAVMVAGAMLTGFAAMNLLKLYFSRDRPLIPDRLVDITTHSFPSGHAMMSAILATTVTAVMLRSTDSWLRNPFVLALPAIASVLIGVSRIYLGAHWTTDVLAGWIFGVVWGAVAVGITARNRFAGR